MKTKLSDDGNFIELNIKDWLFELIFFKSLIFKLEKHKKVSL